MRQTLTNCLRNGDRVVTAIVIAMFLSVCDVHSDPIDIPAIRAMAERGDADAMYDLGVAYSRGLGVEQDFSQSLKWHRRAAEKGVLLAMRSVAMRYEKGEGTPTSNLEAGKWYRKAALQGNPVSMHNLDVMYLDGRGAERDPAMAYAWITIAVGAITAVVETYGVAPEGQRYFGYGEQFEANRARLSKRLSAADRDRSAHLVEELRRQMVEELRK